MYDVRFRVELRCGASESSAEGRGHTIRFSETGCEIVGEFPAVLDDSVELRVYVPDLGWPLRIDRARVWDRQGGTLQVEFRGVAMSEIKRLHMVIQQLEAGYATV